MKQKQQASSLILVLLVVAGIITVIFGTQRVILVQYNQANSEEDNLYAYYAAKAGIEDGLLRYRTSKNVEIPEDNKFEYNARTGDENVITPAFNSGANEQSYDLAIEYKKESLENKKLDRNSTISFSGFTISDSNKYLYLKFNTTTCYVDGEDVTTEEESKTKSFVNIQILKGSSGSITNTNATLNTGTWVSSSNGGNILIDSADKVSKISITPYFCDIEFSAKITGDITSDTGTNDKFDSLQTAITATGYYGNAKRTLVALIDRTSDKLIGIYEFNAYSGLGDIKPN